MDPTEEAEQRLKQLLSFAYDSTQPSTAFGQGQQMVGTINDNMPSTSGLYGQQQESVVRG